MLATLLNRWSRGLGFSLAVHLALLGGLLLFIQWREHKHPVTVDLDLSQLPPMPRNISRGHAGPPPKAWVAPRAGMAPAPSNVTESAEEEPIPCPPPCPDTPGDYLPSGMVSREPRPIGVLLSSDDYPRLAKKKNETGRVVLEIYIDTQGGVRDVHLMVSSSPELNEVAVRKLKEARFEPAYDATGRPVACKMTLPIRFELE